MRKIKVGDWTVTPALNQLECDGRSINIEPQAMDVLVYLAENAGEVVSADELIGAAWQSRVWVIVLSTRESSNSVRPSATTSMSRGSFRRCQSAVTG